MGLFDKLTPQQRLTKAVVKVMGEPMYLPMTGIYMIGSREVDPNIPTACTNGRDEKYGVAMIEAISDANLRYIIIHEGKHKAYRHLKIWKVLYEKDARIANMACDHVINLEIEDEVKAIMERKRKEGAPDWNVPFAEMPTGDYQGLVDEKFRGMNAKQVFDILYQEDKDDDNEGEGGQGGQHGQQKQTKSENEQGSEGDEKTLPQEGQPSAPDTTGSENTAVGFDDHDWEGAQDMSDQEKKDLEKAIDTAVRQGCMAASKSGAGGAVTPLEALLKPQINWLDVLRDFMVSNCRGNDMSTYKTPNRRYIGAGYYFPSGISETVDTLCVEIDMSGSIGIAEAKRQLSEVVDIAKMVRPKELHVLYWDTKVARAEKYALEDLDDVVKKTQPTGGGGTDVTCVPKYLADNKIKPNASIVFTDGYVYEWGTWDHPVLWCIVDNEGAMPDNGKVLHVSSEDI